jgi:hypothetical protein
MREHAVGACLYRVTVPMLAQDEANAWDYSDPVSSARTNALRKALVC